MLRTSFKVIAFIAIFTCFGSLESWARDGLVITIPRRSVLTPVQRLNREGVDAVKNHQFEKAATLFYKAYLYDPADPFTLNNLGYISEIQGDLNRANKFYALASEQGSNANIDRSSAKQLVGKPMNHAFENLQEVPMRVNRMNVDAMALLSEGRGLETIALLRKALSVDPANPFTRNNLGVAYESIGDYDSALKEYGVVADSHSPDLIVVTPNPSWRGKSVSDMAADSARQLKVRIQKMDPAEAHAVMLTVRAVSSTNQNDWVAARRDFIEAYSLYPDSAFSLNNRGYVAERDGDLETAQFFYAKARKAGDSNARVGLATELLAEGKRLSAVATDSNQKVNGELEKYSQGRHQQTNPIELTPRDTTPAGDTLTPQAEHSSSDDMSVTSSTSVPQ